MAAILSGSSRTVLRYIGGHWLDLIQVSLLPFLAISAGLATQALSVRLVKDNSADFALNLLVAIFGTWQWVRVIRLYLIGKSSWSDLSQPVVVATLMTALYWFAIGLVVSVTVVLASIVANIVLAIAFGIGGESLVETMLLLTMFAKVVLIAWIICRFAVGLPAVSLGETPRFFADLWGVSRGATWSYTWRVLLTFVLSIVASVLAVLLYKLVTLGESGLAGIQNSDSAVAGIRDILRSAGDYPILQQIVIQPFGIYFALLTAECYRRFKAARSGNTITAAPRSVRS